MIQSRTSAGVCVITLDRADKANALTSLMLGDLVKAVDAASRDTEVAVVILTGTGRVFSAGADLEEVRSGHLATDPGWEALSSAIANCPVLTIAALNGTAAGGALGMVLACDLRIARDGTKFFYPVIKLGVLPQPSDPARLAALAGPSAARRILLAGDKIGTPEAQSLGLVDWIADDPLAEALTRAEDAIAAGRSHVSAVKSLL